MPTIKCPGCGQEIRVFLIENAYEGPLKCASCKGLFKVSIEGEELKTWQPMTEEELKASQEIEALKAKFKRTPPAD
ncbi:MAG: hypothetical protein ACE5IE_02715 [Dehalococcoidia bacterium]